MSLPALNQDDIKSAEDVAARSLGLPEQARALVIADADDFMRAGAFLVEIKRHRSEIAEAFKPVIDSAHRAHKEAIRLRDRADGPAAEAEAITKQACAAYQREQERLRLEAERRAAEERRRLEAEARARAEAERKTAEAEAERQRIAAAEAALEAGDDERAELILETPAAPVVLPEPAPFVPPPVEVAPVAKAAGVSFKKVFRHTIVNPAGIKREYLCADEKKIAAVVRALGPDAAAAVGGIEVYEDLSVSARAR